MRQFCTIMLLLFAAKNAYAQVPTALRRPTREVPSTLGLEGGQRGAPRTLKALVIAPSLGLNIDDSGTTPVPSIHAQGDTYLLGNETSDKSILFQARFDFNARPAAGNKEDVASRIKLAPGNANLDIGFRASWFPSAPNAPSDSGSFGIDFRVGGTAAYQTGDSAMMGSDLTNSQFGLFSGQATLAFWLWYLYVGAQGNLFFASGNSDVADAIHKTPGFSATAILPIQAGSGADEKAYYVQFTVGGDENDVVTAFTFTAQFSPF